MGKDTWPIWVSKPIHLEIKLEAARRGITMGELVSVAWVRLAKAKSKTKTK